MPANYCPDCGAALVPGKPYCPGCGAPRPVEQTAATDRGANAVSDRTYVVPSARPAHTTPGWAYAGRAASVLVIIMACFYYSTLEKGNPIAVVLDVVLSPIAWAAVVLSAVAQAKHQGHPRELAVVLLLLVMGAMLGAIVASSLPA